MTAKAKPRPSRAKAAACGEMVSLTADGAGYCGKPGWLSPVGYRCPEHTPEGVGHDDTPPPIAR